MVAAVPDEDGLISGLSEDQLVTVDEIDALAKEVGVASRTTPPAYVPIPRLSESRPTVPVCPATERLTFRPFHRRRIEQEIKKVVGESAFMHTKVNQWTSNVVVSPRPQIARANSTPRVPPTALSDPIFPDSFALRRRIASRGWRP